MTKTHDPTTIASALADLELPVASPAHDDAWLQYWDTLTPRSRLFEAQAAEYVENLIGLDLLHPAMNILDFGCGFGYVTSMIADHVRLAYAWDRSRNMRDETMRRTSHQPNVRIVGGPGRLALDECNSVDVILVNSVVQYMEWPELLFWMGAWKNILAPGGAILVSDVIPLDYNSVGDVFDVINLSRRRGFLFEALRSGAKDFASYLVRRQAKSLTRMDNHDLRIAALSCGLDTVPLRSNLTHFSRRNTLVFHHRGQVPGNLDNSAHIRWGIGVNGAHSFR
jgi:SAM-dependent methyltransferase